jgi:hypothetical protein
MYSSDVNDSSLPSNDTMTCTQFVEMQPLRSSRNKLKKLLETCAHLDMEKTSIGQMLNFLPVILGKIEENNVWSSMSGLVRNAGALVVAIATLDIDHDVRNTAIQQVKTARRRWSSERKKVPLENNDGESEDKSVATRAFDRLNRLEYKVDLIRGQLDALVNMLL